MILILGLFLTALSDCDFLDLVLKKCKLLLNAILEIYTVTSVFNLKRGKTADFQ